MIKHRQLCSKKCVVKFYLGMRFITHLNNFARVWACARAIACLSWKGLSTRWVEDKPIADRLLEIWPNTVKIVKYWTSLLKSKQPKCKSFDIVSKVVNDFLTQLKVSFFSYMASLFRLNEKSSSKSSKQFHLGLATKAILKEPKSKDMVSRNDFQKFYEMVSKSVKTAAFKLFNKSPLNLVTMYTSRILTQPLFTLKINFL